MVQFLHLTNGGTKRPRVGLRLHSQVVTGQSLLGPPTSLGPEVKTRPQAGSFLSLGSESTSAPGCTRAWHLFPSCGFCLPHLYHRENCSCPGLWPSSQQDFCQCYNLATGQTPASPGSRAYWRENASSGFPYASGTGRLWQAKPFIMPFPGFA